MIKKSYILFFVLVTFCITVGTNASAQVTSVEANIDSTELLIGSQTVLTFEWEQYPTQTVKAPIFSDTIVNFLEIVEKPTIDTTVVSDEVSKIDIKYVITSFEDTLIYIRPMPFVIDKDTIWSNPLSLKIIQPFRIDTENGDMADIKPIYNPPFDWKNFIKQTALVLLIIILLILLFILIKKYFIKRPKKEVVKITSPTMSAYDEAMNNLQDLEERKLWQNQKTKEYHTELTNILRIYIERVFDIHCMEMTSDEIFNSLSILRREQKESFTALKEVLTLADLVKFAKWTPQMGENEKSMKMAYHFIEETYPKDENTKEDSKETLEKDKK
ncbi:MAG: hypothetical protein CR965_00500 [Paludibacter sp.]|nr:MAG: hypothetical protein CR965_00500 [Paludibacter sp.]